MYLMCAHGLTVLATTGTVCRELPRIIISRPGNMSLLQHTHTQRCVNCVREHAQATHRVDTGHTGNDACVVCEAPLRRRTLARCGGPHSSQHYAQARPLTTVYRIHNPHNPPVTQMGVCVYSHESDCRVSVHVFAKVKGNDIDVITR